MTITCYDSATKIEDIEGMLEGIFFETLEELTNFHIEGEKTFRLTITIRELTV